MRNITIETITEAVERALGDDIPARNRELLTALVRHIHDFAREVRVSHGELLQACEFLRRAGDISDEKRNEFILIADILGLEVLVDMLDHKVVDGESESTVLGPFYREQAPVLPTGADISQKSYPEQATVYVHGAVRDTDGRPIEGAVVDVWEDAPNGLYEQQDPEQPDYNLRGRFTSDAEGGYAFRALRPVPYPIPYDGAAGELLRYMGHHPWRPGHIHFKISKPGYQALITQIYDAETPYLDNDAVFAVKESLVGDFLPAPPELGTDFALTFDFILRPAA